METIALYMRISNEDSYTEESGSISHQRDLLYHYIRSHKEWEEASVVEFCDDGYSGMNFHRPGIQKLLSLAGKEITCIIVKDFSRFGRNLVEVGDYLDQVFPFLGVRFIAVNDGYDSGQETGSSIGLGVSLKAMVSEQYSRDISEKIRCVQQIKMQRGEYLCGIAFYGYKRSETEKNQLVIDPSAAKIVSKIFAFACEGLSPSKIALILNNEGIPSPLMYRRKQDTDKIRGWNTAKETVYWTQDAVRRILTDRRYTGCLISRKRVKEDILTKKTRTLPKSEWIVAEHAQEAIISEEQFIKAQEQIKTKAFYSVCSAKREGKTPKGLFHCAYCGRTLQLSRGKKAFYFCPTQKVVSNLPCKDIYIEKADADQLIKDMLQKGIFLQPTFSLYNNIIKEREVQAAMFQRKIKRYQILLRNVFENFAEGRIGQQKFLSYKKEIQSKQKETEIQYREWLQQTDMIQQKLDPKNGFQWVDDLNLKREWIQTIRVYRENRIEVVWNIQDIFM